MTDDIPFWKAKSLAEMNREEWESLCDGCGRCCLNKIEFEDTGEILYTDVGCKLLDCGTARCKDYSGRFGLVPDCVAFDADNVKSIHWMPLTCAYRLLAEGKELYWWHPLVSGDPDSVRDAGICVGGRIISEDELKDEEELMQHIVLWPHLVPGVDEDDWDPEESVG